MEKMTIEKLAALSDDELSDKLGLNQTLSDAKEALAEMAKMEGKAREYAEERIEDMFKPHVYPNDFSYIVDSAKRKGKKGKEAMDDCCCESVL